MWYESTRYIAVEVWYRPSYPLQVVEKRMIFSSLFVPLEMRSASTYKIFSPESAGLPRELLYSAAAAEPTGPSQPLSAAVVKIYRLTVFSTLNPLHLRVTQQTPIDKNWPRDNEIIAV
jgi:hypothetical protein